MASVHLDDSLATSFLVPRHAVSSVAGAGEIEDMLRQYSVEVLAEIRNGSRLSSEYLSE